MKYPLENCNIMTGFHIYFMFSSGLYTISFRALEEPREYKGCQKIGGFTPGCCDLTGRPFRVTEIWGEAELFSNIRLLRSALWFLTGTHSPKY